MLRAIIAALQFRDWQRKGFASVLIATDMQFVIDGARRTDRFGTRRAASLEESIDLFERNRDMCLKLAHELDRYRIKGLMVAFWLISLEANAMARLMATEASKFSASQRRFTVFRGMGV